MSMKYIMVDKVFPIIFGEALNHRDVVGPLLPRVTSAGFFTVCDGKAQTHGKSISLGLKPCPDDAYFLGLLLKNLK